MKTIHCIYNRQNIRLKGYDYSRAGSYFVTICARNHKSFFGVLLDGEMYLSTEGQIVIECWKSLPERFSGVSLDEYVLMPNYLHGIINISDNQGVINRAPTGKTEFVGAQFIAPPIHCTKQENIWR